MSEAPKIVNVEIDELLAKTEELHRWGYRLAQISCTKMDGAFEINYSFDKDYSFINLRLVLVSIDYNVPSISGIYLVAFLYENEMHDLFGIKIKNLAVDYKGNFYRTQIRAPFSIPKSDDSKEQS